MKVEAQFARNFIRKSQLVTDEYHNANAGITDLTTLLEKVQGDAFLQESRALDALLEIRSRQLHKASALVDVSLSTSASAVAYQETRFRVRQPFRQLPLLGQYTLTIRFA